MGIRNFSIIAHIDHGKSTLADRFLRFAKQEGRGSDHLFDSMALEQERGVTIKLKPVSFNYRGVRLNLIDTPGHADFSYEVSRSLAAVEGALLLVDASQGVQAQTLAHFHVARDLGLAIVPVLNKIDLPDVNADAAAQELADLVGCSVGDVLRVSGKTGKGVPELLDAILTRVPEPKASTETAPAALIFDAVFDDFRGVIAYVRMVSGSLSAGEPLQFLATEVTADILEVGHFLPRYVPVAELNDGDIGYVVTGLKTLSACRVGDTLTRAGSGAAALPGYREPQPVVFASLYPEEGDDANDLRRALEKLQLNDSALSFEGERSSSLGLGFRCGFLGLFHLEIVQERLRREHNQHLVVTLPSVAYEVTLTNGEKKVIRTAQEFPDSASLQSVEEPWVTLNMIAPPRSLGPLMELVRDRRAELQTTEYLPSAGGMDRVVITSNIPLSAILTDFYDQMKSRSSGFASMSYELLDYRPADIVKLDILVAGERADALSALTIRSEAERAGRRILSALKTSVPAAQFEIRLQAAVGGKILAAERIAPLRKDVTAKLYGGDVTRKRKLLEKQKKGKKRMRQSGRVALPAEAYLAVLKKGSGSVE